MSPTALQFGAVAVGGSAARQLNLSNDGRAPLTVTAVRPPDSSWTLSGVVPGDVLAPGASRLLAVRFAPGAEGTFTGELVLETDSPGSRAVQLAGEGGEVRLSASPTALDFGSVEIPGRGEAELVLSNGGRVGADLTVSLAGDAPAAFSVVSAPSRIEPGGQQPVRLAFSPVRLGLSRALLRVAPCPGCAALEVPVTGMGSAGIISVSPERLDFGRVPVGSTASLRLTVSHNGNSPVTFLAPNVQGPTAGAFSVDTPAALPGNLLLPGMAVELTVHFSPPAPGAVAGSWLELPLKASNTDGRVDVPLLGEGGPGCVIVLPREVDFGTVPQGMTAQARVDVLNRCAGEVTLSDGQLLAPSGGYFSFAQPVAASSIPVGGVHPVRLSFTPKPNETSASATLGLKAWEGPTAYGLAVPLRAASRVFQPCAAELLPSSLDFGAVQVGAATSLGVTVRNTGQDDCVVTGATLVPGSDLAFRTLPPETTTLRPGESTVLPVTFQPDAARPFSGLSELVVNDPAGGVLQVPLSGEGVLGCLRLEPPMVDFGSRMLSCGPRALSITAVNGCNGPVGVTAASLAPGSSADLSLVPGTHLPATVQPGGSLPFGILYTPSAGGAASAAFRVQGTSGLPLTAGVWGEALLVSQATELFVQESRARVDVLLVVDNSGSMTEEQASLGANFSALLSSAQALGVDYQLGVTTTGIETSPASWASCPGGAEGGEHGRLFPVDGTRPRIITPTTVNASAVFHDNTSVGVCHWDEQGLEAAYLALSSPLVDHADDPTTPLHSDGNAGFLRDGARLAVIFVSDEDDSSPRPLAFYENFFHGLKGGDPSLLSVSAIVGTAPLSSCPTASGVGTRYEALAQATGGIVQSICTQDWAGSLSVLSSKAFGARKIFPLQGTPADASSLSVAVDGVAVTSGWHYEPLTRSIVFDAGSEPPPGAIIQVHYPLGC